MSERDKEDRKCMESEWEDREGEKQGDRGKGNGGIGRQKGSE